MIKFILAGIWISAVTVASVFFAFQYGQEAREGEAEPSFFGGLDYVTTDVVSVPVLNGNQIHGYFLARLVYTAEAKKLRAMTMPPDAIIFDEVYSHLYANPVIDLSREEGIDLDRFRAGIRDSVNRRLGQKLIHDVLVEQMDFLTKEEIRNSTMRSWVSSEIDEQRGAGTR
jgi:hypothetical protein